MVKLTVTAIVNPFRGYETMTQNAVEIREMMGSETDAGMNLAPGTLNRVAEQIAARYKITELVQMEPDEFFNIVTGLIEDMTDQVLYNL